jgi:hypothetical protein
MSLFINHKYIPAFWYSSNNFGDNLTHYLIKKLSGKTPVLVGKHDPCVKVMVTGSILNNDVTNAVVWGCGLAFRTDEIPEKKQILAVRGKLTGALLQEKGIEFNQVYGDPALLLPRLYNPEVPKIWKLGLLPHYVDTKTIYDKLDMTDMELASYGIRILDINDSVEGVVQQIKSCHKILSSTLHGIIASHAYGVPCEWTKFTDLIGGDDFKYLDYFSSINFNKTDFIDLRGDNLKKETLWALASHEGFTVPLMDIDLNKLWNNCPFRF